MHNRSPHVFLFIIPSSVSTTVFVLYQLCSIVCINCLISVVSKYWCRELFLFLFFNKPIDALFHSLADGNAPFVFVVQLYKKVSDALNGLVRQLTR